MNLIIFGASGRTGQELVRQVLAGGHSVTAFVREPTKMTTHRPNLRLIKGDVKDPTLVEQAMADQDVVLSALGSTQGDPLSVRSEGTRNIVQAMKKHGVKRIIVVLSVGVILQTVAPQYAKVAGEHRRVLEVLQASSLDWIAVCPPSIRPDPGTGRVMAAAGHAIPNAPTITYADLAMFMLEQLTSDQYLRQAVGVANM